MTEVLYLLVLRTLVKLAGTLKVLLLPKDEHYVRQISNI